MINKFVILLRGLPGSGKSTFLDFLKKSINYEISICSKDNFRIKEGKYFFDKKNEKNVEKQHDQLFTSFILNEKEIIVLDNLNISDKNYTKNIIEAKNNQYYILSVNFEPSNISEHAQRNSKGIEEKEIKRLISAYTPISKIANKNFTVKNKNFQSECEKVINELKKYFDSDIIYKPKPKATEAEMDERINFVFEAICKGIITTEMFSYVQNFKPEWKVSKDTIYRYIREAYKKFAELSEKNKDAEFGKSVARLNLLFEKSLKIQDYKTCLSIEKERNALFGLHAKTQIEISGDKENPVQVITGMEIK